MIAWRDPYLNKVKFKVTGKNPFFSVGSSLDFNQYPNISNMGSCFDFKVVGFRPYNIQVEDREGNLGTFTLETFASTTPLEFKKCYRAIRIPMNKIPKDLRNFHYPIFDRDWCFWVIGDLT